MVKALPAKDDSQSHDWNLNCASHITCCECGPSFFWNVTQRWLVVLERHFGTNYRPHIQKESSLLCLNPARICFKISFLVGKIVCCLIWHLHQGGILSFFFPVDMFKAACSHLAWAVCVSCIQLRLPLCSFLHQRIATVGSVVQLDKQWSLFTKAQPSNPERWITVHLHQD
jgi:hypothetical protein